MANDIRKEITRRTQVMNDCYGMAAAARGCGALLDAESYEMSGMVQEELIRSLKAELADLLMVEAAMQQAFQRGIQTRRHSL
jgi:ribosomal protein L16 Arg81 hydroxylase